jgi:hypothetical protein
MGFGSVFCAILLAVCLNIGKLRCTLNGESGLLFADWSCAKEARWASTVPADNTTDERRLSTRISSMQEAILLRKRSEAHVAEMVN